MLTRKSAASISFEANRLCNSPKFEVSRALRRFLSELVAGRFIFQSFAFDEGYSAEQLAALREYAKKVDDDYQVFVAPLGFKRLGTGFDDMFGTVNNGYELGFDIETATLKELQSAVKLVAILAEALAVFSFDPAKEAGFDDYRYRNRPCSIVSDEMLWSVGGHDVRNGNSGVLEWCYDEADANEILASMQRFPGRFKDVKAEPFASRSTGMHWAVEQAVNAEAVAA